MKTYDEHLEQYRVSGKAGENTGEYLMAFQNTWLSVAVIDDLDWECVTVALNNRMPNMTELRVIRCLFWTKDDNVLIFLPAAFDELARANCVRLWRSRMLIVPRPPEIKGAMPRYRAKDEKELRRRAWEESQKRKKQMDENKSQPAAESHPLGQ